MKKILLTIICTLAYLATQAQGSYPSENGLFTINYLKGCVGTTVVVTPDNNVGNYVFCFEGDPNNVGSNENQLCFNEKANQNPPEKYTYTYDSPGVYTVLLLRQISSNQEFDSVTVEIIDPQTPAISTVNCSGEIIFDLNSNQESFDLYEIDFGDGTTQQYSINAFPLGHTYPDNSVSYTVTINASLDNTANNNCGNSQFSTQFVPNELLEESAEITSISLIDESSFSIDYTAQAYQNYYLQVKQNFNGTYVNELFISGESGGSYTFTDLDLNNNFYCARIVTQSLCDNSELASNEVCNVFFTPEATADGNLLDWNSSQYTSSELFKNGNLIYSGSAPFLDTNILCGQSDVYSVRVTDANGISHTSFDEELIAIFGNPTSGIESSSVNTLSDNELHISWLVPQGLQPGNFNIYKKRPNQDEFFLLDSTSNTEYTDIGIDFYRKKFTYAITYTNSCGGESGILYEFQNILLQLEREDNLITLSWNDYTGYGSQLNNYTLYIYDDQMNQLDAIDLNETSYSINTATSDIQKYNYQLEANAADGRVSISNPIEYKIPATFFVPSGFTPDDNGLNDEVLVLGKFIEEIELLIYNRWGNLVFQSNDLNIGWDGYIQDRQAPAGAYSYVVKVIDQYGEEYNKSGIINLIR